MNLLKSLAVAVVALLSLSAPDTDAEAESTLRVAYAGSMGVVMDRFLGPQFAEANAAQYQGIGQGAYGLAHLLVSKTQQADVFVSITPGPIKILQQAGLVGEAIPVASTQMVIAYSPKSRMVAQFDAAAAGKIPFWQVMKSPDLKFGRTDPLVDPQGQNIVFTLLLAERYYRQPGLAAEVLGDVQNAQQIFAEPSILSRLESGQIDASSGYEAAVRSHHLPYIKLPDEINLSNPTLQADWYDKVHFTIGSPDGKQQELSVQPLVYYAAVLKNARDPGLAQKFVDFMQDPVGQKILEDNGYAPPKGGKI